MKVQIIKFSLLFSFMLLTAGCSNQEYERYIEKGLDHLGEKEYHQAALQFERALQQKEGDRTAVAYYHQANQMDNALEEYSEKDFDSALESIEAVIARTNGLKTIEEEAKKLKSKVLAEQKKRSEIEEEITLIESLIANESYNIAEDKLKELQSVLNQDEDLADFQTQAEQLVGEATKGLETMDTAVMPEPKKKQEEEKTSATAPKEEKEAPPPKEKQSYNTYQNERFGFSLQYPEGLTMDPPPTNGDGATFRNSEFVLTAYGGHTNTVQQGETIGTYYKRDMESIAVNIAYKRLADDWYVISYEEAGTIFYKKSFFGENSFNTFVISYPATKQEEYGPVTTHIAETFRNAVY